MTTIPIRRAESESSSLLVLAVEDGSSFGGDRHAGTIEASWWQTNPNAHGNYWFSSMVFSNEDPLIISGSSFGATAMLGLLGVIGALFAGFMADGNDDDSDSAGRIGIVVIIGFGGGGQHATFAIK